jgi:hypothetical protein
VIDRAALWESLRYEEEMRLAVAGALGSGAARTTWEGGLYGHLGGEPSETMFERPDLLGPSLKPLERVWHEVSWGRVFSPVAIRP